MFWVSLCILIPQYLWIQETSVVIHLCASASVFFTNYRFGSRGSWQIKLLVLMCVHLCFRPWTDQLVKFIPGEMSKSNISSWFTSSKGTFVGCFLSGLLVLIKTVWASFLFHSQVGAVRSYVDILDKLRTKLSHYAVCNCTLHPLEA